MHITDMSLFLFIWNKLQCLYRRDPNYILHGLRHLLPLLSSNMAQQRMTIEAGNVTFSNRKQPQHSTTVIPSQSSAQHSNAPVPCVLSTRTHTHIKQTWRSELVKVKALKCKSSCTTGVNMLLSSYTSTNLGNLLYTHIRLHYRTYVSITTVYNTSITERTSVLQLYTILPLQNEGI